MTQEGRALTSGEEKTEDKHNKFLFEIQRATVELLLEITSWRINDLADVG